MKWILVLLGAAVVLFAAKWAFITPPIPKAPPPPDSSKEVPVAEPAPPTPSIPRRDPVKDPPPTYAPDAVPRRVPGAPPKGGAGEIVRTDLTAEEKEKVEATKVRLLEAMVEDVDWRHAGLRKALDQVAGKAGVPIEIEGEGLDDEPVLLRTAGESALELLRTVTMQRNLRFEVTAEKVIVRR
jgi:hypothetical protein